MYSFTRTRHPHQIFYVLLCIHSYAFLCFLCILMYSFARMRPPHQSYVFVCILMYAYVFLCILICILMYSYVFLCVPLPGCAARTRFLCILMCSLLPLRPQLSMLTPLSLPLLLLLLLLLLRPISAQILLLQLSSGSQRLPGFSAATVLRASRCFSTARF